MNLAIHIHYLTSFIPFITTDIILQEVHMKYLHVYNVAASIHNYFL